MLQSKGKKRGQAMDPKDTKTPTQTPEPAQTSTTPPAAPVPPAPGAEPAKKGYGKRPMWQWIVLYLAIAVVVYLVVYFLFFKGNSAGSGVGY